VGAGEKGQPDPVHVLLQGSGDNHLRRLVKTGIDDFEPGVPEGPGDDLGAAIVSVQSHLADQEPDLSLPAHRHSCTRPSRYAPKTVFNVSQISPTEAYARTASRMAGIRFSFVRAVCSSLFRTLACRSFSLRWRTVSRRATSPGSTSAPILRVGAFMLSPSE